LAKFAGVAGESFAANKTYAVRFAIAGETAGRLYKADNDASTTDKFHVIGLLSVGGSAVSAGDTVTLYMMGSELTTEANDPTITSGLVGTPLFLGTNGALTFTPPTAANSACVICAYAKTTSLLMAYTQIMGVN
jgi:hypothetical protein